MATQLTIADVERIAALAHLELTDAEKQVFTRQLADILAYAEQLQSIDTDDLLRSHIQGRRKGFEDAESVIESLDRSNAVDARFKLLLRLVNKLSATLDLQRLCDKLAEQLLETFEADRVVVLTMEDERRLKPFSTRSRSDAVDESYTPSRTVIRGA